MDSLLIFKDTITAHVVKVVDSYQPCVKEAETNWADLSIVNGICCYLFWIVVVCVAGFLFWKIVEMSFQRWDEGRKHEWEIKNRKWKLRSDLMDKLLDHLKNEASEKSDSKDGKVKGKNLSIKDDDIFELLKENADKYKPIDLRKQYIELCVTILQAMGRGDNGDKTSDNQNPSTEQSTESANVAEDCSNTIEQIPSITDSKQTVASQKTETDKYLNVLCTFLGMINKEVLDNEDINTLKKSCGLAIE